MSRKSIILTVMVILLAMAFNASADNIIRQIGTPEKIRLVSGKSVVLETTQSISRVSIANPDIASNMVLSPKELYITGKAAGTTNLILWHRKKMAAIYNIVVSYDLSLLREQIQELMPGENELNILSTNSSITLSGKVSSAANLQQAIALAESYAPKGKVKNLVEVGGVHQVMLEVRIAEMTKSLGREMGINMSGLEGTATINNLEIGYGVASNTVSTDSSVFNALLQFTSGNFNLTTFIDLMQGEGLVKVLAEPTLVALSGQTAKFLAGGEYPIPTSGGMGTSNVEYKEYGVSLSFTPTVVSSGRITIVVAPEVSELDFSTATRVEGFVVPGISTRRTSTTIILADGQSFVIAGLLKDTARTQSSKYPLLGDIPILGALFRSKKFQKSETELVILVTPRLVKPIDGDKQPLPTDFYIEPNAAEFYFGHSMEGSPAANTKGKLDFGHVVPKN